MTDMDGRGLSERDGRHLAGAEAKFQMLRDRVDAVALGYSTGLYVHGPGGCGKSHQVLDELQRLAVPYRMFNSRMTGRGLYNVLEQSPDEVHVLEDMEPLTRDRGAQGVLRSACWAQGETNRHGKYERTVTWITHRMEHRFTFTGGIIMLANRSLGDVPELQAVKSRIDCIHLHLSSQEVVALMRSISLNGYRHGGMTMSPAEASEVCEFVIKHSLQLERNLDLRLLVNSYKDYLQWQEVSSGCVWQDMVMTRINERPTDVGPYQTVAQRDESRQRELQIAAEIRQLPRGERARQWLEQTGKSEQTLYRRLQEQDES